VFPYYFNVLALSYQIDQQRMTFMTTAQNCDNGIQ